jgi:hypothetical protein
MRAPAICMRYIRATRRLDLEKQDAEFVVIELIKPNKKSVLLYTFYRPPNSTTGPLQHLNSSKTPVSPVVVL